MKKRVIKFRYFCNRTKRYLTTDNMPTYGEDAQFFELDGSGKSVFEQFTGLKDKDGIEVFEGDVIRVNDKNQYGKIKKLIYEVQFIDSSFMCILINGDRKYKNIYPKSLKNQPNIEVIGNIHENNENSDLLNN